MMNSAGARRMMAGSRTMNGKRYAFETEVIAFATHPDGTGTHQLAVPVVLDNLPEMLHRSLAAFSDRALQPTPSSAPEKGAEAAPRERDYDSLLDCVITDQREADLPAYLLDLVGNLGHKTGPNNNVQGRLVFVIAGQMIESDESNR